VTLGALLLGALALAQGPTIPPNDGWVTDRAGLLKPAEEQALETLCESYRAGSGQEIAVLIVPDLGGRPIEELALATAREWKIGDKETSAGALLVVARDEHALRIEVGRGLEGALPDSVCARIIRDVIVPEFRAERFYAGLNNGLQAMHRALGGDYGALPQGRGRGNPLEALPALLVLGFFVFLAIRRGRGRGSSALPWLIASQLGRGGSGFGGRSGGFGGGGGGGGFGGFGGGGGFSGGGASGRW